MYEAVTADEFELPICYGITTYDLASKLGVSPTTVMRAVHRGSVSKVPYNKQRYKIVKVEEKVCLDCKHCKWMVCDNQGNKDYRCDIDGSVLPQVVCNEYKEKQ